MKNLIKKTLSILLAMVTCFSMAMTAFADSNAAIEKSIRGTIISKEVIEILPDGSKIVKTVVRHVNPILPKSNTMLSATSDKYVTYSVSHEQGFQGINNATATLTATFRYNEEADTVSKTSAYH